MSEQPRPLLRIFSLGAEPFEHMGAATHFSGDRSPRIREPAYASYPTLEDRGSTLNYLSTARSVSSAGRSHGSLRRRSRTSMRLAALNLLSTAET